MFTARNCNLSNLVCIASNLTTVLDNELYPNLATNVGVSNRVNFTATAGTHYQVQVSGLTSGPISSRHCGADYRDKIAVNHAAGHQWRRERAL